MRRRLAPLFLLLAVLAWRSRSPGAEARRRSSKSRKASRSRPTTSPTTWSSRASSTRTTPRTSPTSSASPSRPEGQEYFGVFIQVKNDGDEDITIPEAFRVVDTLDNSFDPLDSESPYALPLGDTLEPNRELPETNSIAADGPTQGSLVLFLVEQSSAENRPLELEIPLPSGKVGTIELDI